MLRQAECHEGALIETCQRLEAVGFASCTEPTCKGTDGEEAFTYLCSLAAGLESIVLGETEILGQLRAAGRGAAPETASVLARAVAIGRAFRRRNELSADAGDLFDLCRFAAGISVPGTAVVAGSGPTARRLAARGTASGVRVTVASRVAPTWASTAGLTWVPLGALGDVSAGVAFVCLGGDAQPIPSRELRADVIFDVSTPRRTEHGDQRVVGLAAVREHVAVSEGARRAGLRTALRHHVRRAIEASRQDATSPVGRLRQSVELLRQEEMTRLRRRHPEIPEATIDAVTRSMVNRMFHHPVSRLKSLEPDIAASVADLFAAPARGGRE